MKINFNEIQEMTMPCMNGGEGLMSVRMFNDEHYRIIPTKIHKGGGIGLHTQNSGDDLNFVISGSGIAVCDGTEEELKAGVMHICPKGADVTAIMVIVGAAFGLLEDLPYAIGSNPIQRLVRGFTMGHLGYGFIMGWFYGKKPDTSAFPPALRGSLQRRTRWLGKRALPNLYPFRDITT